MVTDPIKWLDDFSNYTTPDNDASHLVGTNWFTTSYSVYNNVRGGSTNFGIRNTSIQGFATRTCLWGWGRFLGATRPIMCMLPFRRISPGQKTGNVYIGMRVLRLPSVTHPASTAQIGVIRQRPNSSMVDCLFGITIISRNVIRVSYCDDYGIRQQIDVDLPYPFAGTHDVLEVIFSKPESDNPTATLGALTVWVNNRVAFSRYLVNQVGNLEDFNIVLMGAIDVTSTTAALPGYVSAFSVTSEVSGAGLEYGITDLVITATPADTLPTRYGKVRVSSRTASLDAIPNDFTMSAGAEGAETHAAVVSTNTYDLSKYLIGPNIDSTEVYVGPQFPDLGSQSVLGVAIKSVGSKLDPNGFDLSNLIRLGSDVVVSNPEYLLSSPTLTFSAMSKNPVTGLGWRASEVNASQFGVRVALSEEEDGTAQY